MFLISREEKIIINMSAIKKYFKYISLCIHLSLLFLSFILNIKKIKSILLKKYEI